MNIDDFKKQYPQYADMDNGELAFKTWSQSYSEDMPMGIFADKINLSKEDFGKMIAFGKSTGYEPTKSSTGEDYLVTSEEAETYGRMMAPLRGASIGLSDEMGSAINAAKDVLSGNAETFGQAFSNYQAQQKAIYDKYAEENAGEAFLLEVTGAINPASLTMQLPKQLANATFKNSKLLEKAPQIIQKLVKSPTAKAMAGGAAYGGIYGATTAEGGIEERLQEGAEALVPGALFGYAGQKIYQIGSAPFRKLMNRSVSQPTQESLKAAKDAAYASANSKGISYSTNEISNIQQRALKHADESFFNPDIHKDAAHVLNILNKSGNKPMKLQELENLKKYINKTKQSDTSGTLSKIADDIDDLMLTSQSGGKEMLAARAANSRYKKFQMIDEAFTNVERSAQKDAIGYSLARKYKDAIDSILKSPNKRKWFTQEEQQIMDSFVRGGGFTEDVMRKLGKLSPTSSNTSALLNILASSPVATMATMAARGSSEKAGIRGAQEVRTLIGGGQLPSGVPFSPRGTVAGVMGGQMLTGDILPEDVSSRFGASIKPYMGE